jgi:hypothetical protein
MAQWSEEEAARLIRAANSAKMASEDLYREAVELTFPDRENFYKTAEGQDKSFRQWDSTSQVSLIRAANRLSADFTPQFQDWIEIGLGPAADALPDDVFRDRLGMNKEELKTRLEITTSIVQAVYNGPGFPTASNELYLDWHLGQGGMTIMPNDDVVGDPVLFQAMPISHWYAYEGPNGRLDRWFFWHEFRADVLEAQWPDIKLTEELQQLKEDCAQGKTRMAKFCSVVYRDYDIKPTRQQPRPETFRYEVFFTKGHKASRVVNRTYRSSPMVTPRHTKLAGENRGRGPVIFALPDIRTANKVVELTLRGVAVAIAGIYTATEDALEGPINFKPYSVIQVRSNGGPSGPSLQRLDSPQRIDFGQLVLDQLHMNIRKIIGDHALPPEAGPIRTATEFIQRARELVADQAGGLGRLLGEFIVPATQRTVDILERKNILPWDGLVIDQFLVEVRMTSSLAKGQAMQEVENIVRFIEMMTMIMGGQPALAAYEIDFKKVGGEIADLMDVPRRVRNNERQKKQMEQGIAGLLAQQAGADPAAAQQANAQAQAAEEEATGGA